MSSSERPTVFSEEWLDEVVSYHAFDAEQLAASKKVRVATAAAIRAIVEACPNCADRSAAIRHFREGMMEANASIALKGLV